jgi:hypothetical protein
MGENASWWLGNADSIDTKILWDEGGLLSAPISPSLRKRRDVRGHLYASFNPAPRLPRNSTPLAVSMKADLAWLSVGST